MMTPDVHETKRQRAPSKRALVTKARVLDAAEKVFARKGFDGATIRDIATQAGESLGTVHHHGGGKEKLFFQTVARRADVLSQARLTAMDAARSTGSLTLEAVLTAFLRPLFDLAQHDLGWRDYARLVAIVSSENRWHSIRIACFDETAEIFIHALQTLLPDTSKQQIAAHFVFSVSALLALVTSRERIAELGAGNAAEEEEISTLVRFCAAGFASAASTGST